MKSQPLFREHGRQAAALCWRIGPRGLEVLLITSLNAKRWILPKGWLEAGLTGGENAAREAFEEAGVTGKVGATPIGHYLYLKEKQNGGGMPVNVEVFDLRVTKQLDDWPERDQRNTLWVSLDQAVAKVSEPGLRDVLRTFRRHHAAQKPAMDARRQL